MTELSAQMIGRLGELAVERELLTRGWMVGNFNASLANAAAYDLFAVKGYHRVCLRIKTTSGSMIQYSAKKDGEIFRGLLPQNQGDYTVIVLVERGEPREFYILPTQVVNDRLVESNLEWHKGRKRDGSLRKVTLHRALDFNGPETPVNSHRGMRLKWLGYLNAWESLVK